LVHSRCGGIAAVLAIDVARIAPLEPSSSSAPSSSKQLR
jgi:hypothetical protein